jgi:hypothetical protein
LKLSVEQAGVLVEDAKDLFADLGEEVEPLEVSGKEKSLRCVRAEVGARMDDLELLDRAPTLCEVEVNESKRRGEGKRERTGSSAMR